MKTALVTGATSFLGRELTGALMAAGVDAHALVRPGSDLGRFDALPRRPAVHVHDGTTESMAAVVMEAAPDAVFHLATHHRKDHVPDDIAPLVEANVLLGAQLLDAMRRAGVRRLVTAATFAQRCNSDDYRPLNLYAATKQAFEDILAYYADAAGIEAVTLVLYDVYGPGDWRAKLLAAIRDAQRSGTPLPLPEADAVLDLVYVDDVVAAFLLAAELLETRGPEVAGRAFAVSSGARHRLSEVIAVFEEVGGAPVAQAWGRFPTPARRIEVPWIGPPLPGWRPRVPLAEGVRRYLAG